MIGGALGLWAAVTVGMVGYQGYSSWQNRDMIARQQAVVAAEARVAANRSSVARTAGELGARQDALEAMFGQIGGDLPSATSPAETAAGAQPDEAGRDTVSQLGDIRQRQTRLITAMTDAFSARAARAEEALRKVGINPGAASRGAQGGPLNPIAALSGPQTGSMRTLVAGFTRMQQLEQLVLSLPSFTPAQVERMSSGFGYRRDPITGGGAMHAGLDFTGDHGSPILAAAPGRISHSGRQSGYGNTIEIDHGHGIMTRYAHLSGLDARVGQTVTAGQQVGRMGSTGRSTGTHLHFEVRVGGTPVNPRRFLEGNADVLEIQADAGGRSRHRIGAR